MMCFTPERSCFTTKPGKPALTSIQEKGNGFFSSAASNGASVLVFERNGGVRVGSWEVALFLDAAIHGLQPLCGDFRALILTV